MSQELLYLAVFICGMLVGVVVIAFISGANPEVEHPDSTRLDFLSENDLSLHRADDRTIWGVTEGSPVKVVGIGLSARQALDKAREVREAEQ